MQKTQTAAKANKWSIKETITAILLSIFLIVIQFIINTVCMLNYFVSMVLSLGISGFLCAPVYVLMVRRVGKPLVSFLCAAMTGLVFLIMGDWFLLPYFIIIGILCELILRKKGSYQHYGKITAAWSLYSVMFTGVNLLPLWFFWDDFEKNVLASGMRQDYIDSYVGYYSKPLWIFGILLINLTCAVLGCLLARRLMKKHFARAGIL
jgi:energy-coupling factor transport system substrate-specific component